MSLIILLRSKSHCYCRLITYFHLPAGDFKDYLFFYSGLNCRFRCSFKESVRINCWALWEECIVSRRVLLKNGGICYEICTFFLDIAVAWIQTTKSTWSVIIQTVREGSLKFKSWVMWVVFNNYSPQAQWILSNNPRDEVEGIILQYSLSLRQKSTFEKRRNLLRDLHFFLRYSSCMNTNN